MKRGRKKKRRTIFLEMSRKRENDKWIFGLDRTSLPSPLKNLSRECERFDGWRGAIMCGKFAPRKSPENFSNRSKSGSEEIYEASPGGSFPTPFFFIPSLLLLPSPPPRPYRPLVSSAGSAGLFIFAVSKRVTDDGTMLIIPSMWEPIVARSYRGRE